MNVLMLQGPFSPLFTKISNQLNKAGCQTHKINLCGGDLIFNLFDVNSKISSFGGHPSEWERYVTDFILANSIDFVLFHGDCHFYHAVTRNVCNNHGVKVYVTEEGYIRGGLITLEYGGVNAFSPIVSTRKDSLFNSHSETPSPVASSPYTDKLNRLLFCSIYYVFVALGKRKFKHYHHRRKLSFSKEVKRLSTYLLKEALSLLGKKKINNELGNYIFIPLQVDFDSQLITHSNYDDNQEFIDDCLLALSQTSNKSIQMVFKNHPESIGYKCYSTYISKKAYELGLDDRVSYLELEDTNHLISNSSGVVTINSTVGLSSLCKYVPTKCMGNAVYKSISSDQGLVEFITNPKRPDYEEVENFRNMLLSQSLVGGNLYSKLNRTADNVCNRLISKEIAFKKASSVVI